MTNEIAKRANRLAERIVALNNKVITEDKEWLKSVDNEITEARLKADIDRREKGNKALASFFWPEELTLF